MSGEAHNAMKNPQPRIAKFMDGNQIRKVLLEVVDELSKRPHTVLQSGWILQETQSKLALGNQIEHQRALLTYFHDLFRLGHLAWGSDLLNANPPFCHVTEQGRRTLANISRDPANPDGYLQYLVAKHSLSPITRSYVIEALSTYNSGCFKASAVMIGVAAESIVLEVRDILTTRLDSLERSKPKELMSWRVKIVLDAIEKLLSPKKKDMPKSLRERFESYWSAFTQQIRTIRNESGHPISIEPVSQDTVHASLLIFPELADLAQDLTAWINESWA
jgi:hypothetical protein